MSNFTLFNETFGRPNISTAYPEQFDTGPFSPIVSVSDGSININPNSNIFIGYDLSSVLNITNKNMRIAPINSDSNWNVWLEVFFANGAPYTANFNYTNKWWDNYPLMQEYNQQAGQARSLSTQVALRIPVFTISSLSVSDKVVGKVYNFNDNLIQIQRHIVNDLILFQSCDGFIFLPSASSKPVDVFVGE